MIKDIQKINEILIQQKKENTKFYSFLKTAKKINIALLKFTKIFYKEAIDEINCKECANCCISISPILKNTDIDRISKHLKIKPYLFIEQYLRRDEDDDLVFKSLPCPFLENNLCTIYDIRPNDCRSYPHIEKKQITTNFSYHTKNCYYCPITFNVFEKLKKHFLKI